MGIQYDSKVKDDYLVVRAEAVCDNVDEMIGYIDDLVRDCTEHHVRKMLLDHRELQFQGKYGKTYDLAARCIDKIPEGGQLRIALIARPERMEFAKVYETIGVSRGVEIKAFTGPNMAAAWLRA